MKENAIFDAARATPCTPSDRCDTGVVIDPHTAVGVAVAERLRGERGTPMVTLATAHPAKLPDAVERAIGVRPALPDRLADLYEREERCTTLPNDLAAVMHHIREHAAPVGNRRSCPPGSSAGSSLPR